MVELTAIRPETNQTSISHHSDDTLLCAQLNVTAISTSYVAFTACYCGYCGKRTDEPNDIFCGYCGSQLDTIEFFQI